MKGYLVLNEDNFNPEVTRLYVTRGDNLVNYDGVKSDKFAGLEINNQIYWMNLSFANVKQLSGSLFDFIHIEEKWFASVSGKKGDRKEIKSITKINCHHDDIFESNKKYLKKAVRNPYANDSLWWTPSDLRQHFKHTQA